MFRDMTDLKVGDLFAQIHSALEQSHFLVVVCSPSAAASKWVSDEVEYFVSHDKTDMESDIMSHKKNNYNHYNKLNN